MLEDSCYGERSSYSFLVRVGDPDNAQKRDADLTPPLRGDTQMDFKVADLSLADYGRTEITLAEHEMPGLMAMRAPASGFESP